MGLKDTIREKSKALVLREPLKLPRCGETVTIRGLMAGEQLRIGAAAAEKQPGMFAALGVEDGSGNPLWLAHSLDDMNDIAALHGDDLKAILDGVRKLSGMDQPDRIVAGEAISKGAPITIKDGKAFVLAEDQEAGKAPEETKNSGSSSASATESPPMISVVA